MFAPPTAYQRGAVPGSSVGDIPQEVPPEIQPGLIKPKTPIGVDPRIPTGGGGGGGQLPRDPMELEDPNWAQRIQTNPLTLTRWNV